MTDNRKPLARRALAGLSAAALGITGLVALGTAAQAAVGPDQPDAPSSGSLTIHKYLGQPTNPALPNNGTDLNPAPENDKPADGVEFTIQQVGVQDDEDCVPIGLKTPAGWDQVAAATAGAPALPYCLKDVANGTKSTVGGVAEFTGLDLGLYYVTEGEDTGGNNIVRKASPFYVTVPYPSGEQAVGENTVVEWTYKVHVYPKNATADVPTKTIDETQHGLKVGDKVTWTITQTVPTLHEGDKFTQAQITDVLDSRLTLDSATIKLDGVELASTDWEKINPEHTWSFTPAGRVKLDAAMGKDITVELNTTVTSVGSGEIDNGPWNPDTNKGYYSQFNNEPPHTGDDDPFTYWGELKITKVDESNRAKGLEGAEFSVFEGPESGECPATSSGLPIATGESNGSGVVFWDNDTTNNQLGLLIKNSNTEVTPAPSKNFCIYETKEPAGYTALDVPKPVTITAGELSTTNGGLVTVENKQKDGPDLPLTGASGTILMIVGGLGLVAVAGGTHLVLRRRLGKTA